MVMMIVMCETHTHTQKIEATAFKKKKGTLVYLPYELS